MNNLISWNSTDLKSDDNYNNYNADEMYCILSKWFIYKLQDTTNNELENTQSIADEDIGSFNDKSPILINLTRNNGPENEIKSLNEDVRSNEVDLSNHRKSTHSVAMTKMRLTNIRIKTPQKRGPPTQSTQQQKTKKTPRKRGPPQERQKMHKRCAMEAEGAPAGRKMQQ